MKSTRFMILLLLTRKFVALYPYLVRDEAPVVMNYLHLLLSQLRIKVGPVQMGMIALLDGNSNPPLFVSHRQRSARSHPHLQLRRISRVDMVNQPC